MNNVINAVVNQTEFIQYPGCSSNHSSGSKSKASSNHVDKCNCEQLKTDINELNTIITQLNIKVEFLMSFLNLKDDVPASQSQAQSAKPASLGLKQQHS